MVPFSRAFEELLPAHLHDVLEWDFIPWEFIRNRYGDSRGPDLRALFEAYLRLASRLDLEAQVSQVIPAGSWGCMRCGFCCSFMQPRPVRASTYKVWEKAAAPVAWFYNSRGNVTKDNVYRCWYHDGVRLRICPFMLINRNDHRPFCTIYGMGENFRPPTCSKYIPRHPSCTSRLMEIEPWESC